MTSKVLVEIKAPVATITLNKPERLNAVDVEVWEGIRDAAVAVDDAPGVRVAILQGAGGAFCAGLDVKQARRWAISTPGHPPLPWSGSASISPISRNASRGSSGPVCR